MPLPSPGATDCTSGFSGRIFGDWTNDTSRNGLISPLSGSGLASVQSLCYAIAKAISDEIAADAPLDSGGIITTAPIVTLACATSLNVGDLVAVVGGQAVQANATDITHLPCVGCAVQKPTTTSAMVQFGGVVSGIYALTQGAMVFVGTNGRPCSGPPALLAPGVPVYIQPIGFATDNATLLLLPSMQLSCVRAEPG